MSGWVRKRFWTDVDVGTAENGYTIKLDGRAVRTPGKAALIVPTRALADILAEEWRAQGETLAPESMPATRAANVAIDKVREQKDAVTELLADYGDSDLVCYRAESPEELVKREAQAWDPLLDWAAHRYGHRPVVCCGVIHVAQPKDLLDNLRTDVDRLTNFELTAFHDLVTMSGSLIIALAVLDRYSGPEALWQVSRIDEDWQITQWGEDDEARVLAEGRRAAFLNAARFYFALQS